nr:MAG TPA: Mor transcription activator family [Caudoviricetes sp.]
MQMNEQNSKADFADLLHLLPSSFAGIVAIVGVDAAFLLVKHLGGTSFKIGANKRKGGKVLHFALAEWVGEANATRIETALKGQRELYIPKCEALLREMRNRQIRHDFDGLTLQKMPMKAHLAIKNLARQYQLSERMVWGIVNSPPAAPQSATQMGLFA